MPPQKEIALIRHVYVPIGNNMKTTLTMTAFDAVKRDSGLFYVVLVFFCSLMKFAIVFHKFTMIIVYILLLVNITHRRS
jgi:hypothetical protein